MDIQYKFLASRRQKYLVALVLLASFILRSVLVFQGGQYYFSDEQRYQSSREVAAFLIQGNWKEAGLLLYQTPEHLGYKVFGIVPALLEQVMGQSRVLPALFFSLFSVFNLYLIFLLAQKQGAPSTEALIALVFASLSQCLFYYSRHLVPYDVAMTFGLLAVYIGLTRSLSKKASLACGALGFLCFITYNGYWSLTGLAMLVHVLVGKLTFRGVFLKGIYLAAGFMLPWLILIAVSASMGINLPVEYSRFAQTVTQGSYAEGWSLPFAYFWHTEHALLITFSLLGLVAVLNRDRRRVALVWAGCIIFLYLCLVVPSAFFQVFVVLGRTTRQLMPFLILLAASGLTALLQYPPTGRRIGYVVLLAAIIQGAVNFNSSLGVSYPKDFVRAVQTQFPEFEFSPKRFSFGAPEICENHGYAMQNAKYFLAAPKPALTLPGEALLAASHPVNFLPYQYEGYTPGERQRFRSVSPEMVFYRLDMKAMEKNDFGKSGLPSCVTH